MKTIKLPEPQKDGKIAVEKVINLRKSIRNYKDEPLKLEEVSQLLWAAQGKSESKRTAPSAGALYPLEIFVVAGNVENLAPGVYKYEFSEHEIRSISSGDKRHELWDVALAQQCIKEAPISIVIAAVFERTTGKYGERGIRYAHAEVGHASQNIYLQCIPLGLGTVVIGAFDDLELQKLLNIKEEKPLYIMPVGKI